jgi:hypothetical protein
VRSARTALKWRLRPCHSHSIIPLTARWATLYAELREFRDHVSAVCGRSHLAVDIEDLAIDADVERPSCGSGFVVPDYAIRLGGTTLRIAEEGVIHLKLRGKLPVVIKRIDADREKRDVKCANLVAALTERLALCRSTSAGRSRKPGQHHGLFSPVIR